MQENEFFKFDYEGFIERAKLFLNLKSDSQLSSALKKSTNYIAQCRSRGNVDIELILNICHDSDFNWLITGKKNKVAKIAELDSKGNRVELENRQHLDTNMVDLNAELNKRAIMLQETQWQLFECQKLLAKYQLKDNHS